MLRITKEKLYLGDIHIPREFLEKNLKLKFEADFVCVDEEKSFKIHNSNQGSLSKQEEKNVKFLLKNKDKIIRALKITMEVLGVVVPLLIPHLQPRKGR